MPQWLGTDIAIIFPSVTLTVMLALFVLTDAYLDRDHRNYLFVTVFFVAVDFYRFDVEEHRKAYRDKY